MIRTTVLALFSLVFMIFHADLVVKGAASGLLLWYSAVVPALFPFMVLSSVLSASGGISRLMRPFLVVFRFSRLSANGWYALLTGLLCGCPMGAKTCADLLREKRIAPGEARFLFALCNHPSPMFLAGFVYPLFSGKLPLSYFIFAIYAPLFLLAFPAHWIYRRSSDSETSSHSKLPRENSGRSHQASIQDPAATVSPGFPEPDRSSGCAGTLDTAILNSAEILVKIGGYLVFYSILILVVQSTPMIPAPVRLFLSGVLEITTGIHVISDSLTYPGSAIAAAAVFAFGGFSAVSQTNAVIRVCEPSSSSFKDPASRGFSQSFAHKKTAGLSIRQYLLWKTAHASLTAAIMAALTGVLRFPVF